MDKKCLVCGFIIDKSDKKKRWKTESLVKRGMFADQLMIKICPNCGAISTFKF